MKQWFPTPWTQSLIIPIFNSGDKNDPSSYHTIMINPLLAKLYGIILQKKINKWLEMEGKRAKGQEVLEGIIQPRATSLHLGSLQRNVVIISLTYFVALWIYKSF